MTYDPQRHHRRSIRLKGYDYSQAGAYFITICTQDRACLLGDVVDGEMQENEFGEIVRAEWFASADIRQEIRLNPDEFVVMPNHIHGIVWIIAPHRRGDRPVAPGTGNQPTMGDRPIMGDRPVAPTNCSRSVGSLIAGFKSAATKKINRLRGTPGAPLWQRNYYEHIIRNDKSLCRIRQYITNNPLRWDLDRMNASHSDLR
jgi:REP element-mobilizing transposase RayT